MRDGSEEKWGKRDVVKGRKGWRRGIEVERAGGWERRRVG